MSVGLRGLANCVLDLTDLARREVRRQNDHEHADQQHAEPDQLCRDRQRRQPHDFRVGRSPAICSQRSARSVEPRRVGMPSNVRTWLLTSWLTTCTPHPATDTEVHEVRQSAQIAPAPQSSPPVTTTRPLQRWMESDLLYRIRAKDFRGLVRSLDALATVAPPQYPNWAEVASRAAQAARAGDVEAVRRGCAACHQQYRSRYRSTPVAYDIDRLIERSRM